MGQTVETTEFGKMVRRMLRAYVRRVGGGADLESLAGLSELRAVLNQSISEAAGQLHEAGYSWTEIARVLGISRQAARERFSK